MSMCQFLLLMGDVIGHLAAAGGGMRYLVTRYEPSDGVQTQMVAFMRSLFGQHVPTHPMLKSVAVPDAGITKQTLYEVERKHFTPSTYDRAMECLDAVNGETESLIHATWAAADGAQEPAVRGGGTGVDSRQLGRDDASPAVWVNLAGRGALGAVTRSIDGRADGGGAVRLGP